MGKFVCKICKGDNVQIRAWINANTHEYQDDSILDDTDTWCEDCEDHKGLEIEKTIKPKKESEFDKKNFN